ncbi:solute carrier family protein [Thecamonas trahens ATCC 50062]|uniref:Solute carrier family protein n=1 Tax=Thecamonas trahens ATCC 50062 TaxID=461836 RepID=A0A0L0D8V1_THETB|nr:solute carrier family protein [Thecamonas trahens ATCC 50062]KNC48807.1 solute carrier family protein [Thecamonas trahens ATCC 50062]|eukprot:XP_013762858.1 solute carrier family protein [Thecamonas trahens ATCC 50062]
MATPSTSETWRRGRLEDQAIRAAFERLDTDGNGSLDRKEFAVGMRSLGIPVTDRAVDEVFNSADANSDGVISYAEFVAFAARRTAAMAAVFDQLDTDDSGALDVAELRRGLESLGLKASDADISALLERMDANHDGRITFDEFRDFLMMLPASNVRACFEYWAKSAAIDIGESLSMPDDLDALPRPPWKTLVAGACAGAVSRTATAPADRIKVMLQAGSAGGVPPGGGIRATMTAIYAEGGLRAYWRGNGVNVLKVGPETAARFFFFSQIKALVASDPRNISVAERFTSGALAGVASTVAIYPMEVAKTRLAISKPGSYTGIIDCLAKTFRASGISGVYAGLGPSLVGVVPYVGIDFVTYSYLKELYATRFHDSEPGAAVVLACGMLSSTAGQIAAYPAQVTRTRLQAQGMPGVDAKYSGMLDCGRKIAARHGVTGLYRGLGANLLKGTPSAALSWFVYEQVVRRLDDN